MENRNELVAQMAEKIREEHIQTIKRIVKKYCPSIEIDDNFLRAFAQEMTNLSGDWFSAEQQLDKLTDGWRPDPDEQDRLISEIEKIKGTISAKAQSPEIIDAMAKAKYVSSVLTYKAGQYSEKISLEEQKLLDIREAYRLDEFDPTTEEKLAEYARGEHPDYRNIEVQLEEDSKKCDMIDRDRSDLNSAIAGYEKDAFINHNSFESISRYEYWPSYTQAVDTRVADIQASKDKGGKK